MGLSQIIQIAIKLGDGEGEPIRKVAPQQVFTTQLILCLTLGIILFFLFCILRYRWPHIYAVRTLRIPPSTNILKPLPNNWFGWIRVVYGITDDEILVNSGLDAFVYLSFFKMGIKIFAILGVMAVCILSPLRYYFTGSYDKDSIGFIVFDSIFQGIGQPPPDIHEDFPQFLWVYPIFTYVFSIVVYYCLYDFTNQVLRTRQKYLASQNSITDRTIRLDGIPKKLQQTYRLKKFIEDLGIGNVIDVKLIYDWSPLEKLFTRRTELIENLEYLYASLYNLDIDIYSKQRIPSVTPIFDSPADGSDTSKELIKQYSEELISLDQEIRMIQNKFDANLSTIDVKQHSDFKQVPSAFITMDSVASAQMAAQTVLDPRVYKLIVNLAPAPKDIIWGNLKLTFYQKLCKSYLITFLIVLSYGFIIFLVVPLTSLLDLKTISKFWPSLGKVIGQSEWLTTFVTGILPPLLFTLLNVSFPYFYKWLSQYQGHSSNSDVELSTLSKNFFFIFFNLFLIYVAAGTFWDYISYISDTTKIAVQLATSLKRMALFYVDLILLQGLTMFPVKLLQVSDFLVLNILGKCLPRMFLRTPRNYRRYYYTPQIFDFGIHLPQHILIFMIILIYSVVSTKIVTCGLVYFIMGLLVYKYQLVYNFVHPPHSTGKVWPMIFHRVMLGLIIFQLFMCGTLALESAILLSIMCTPLIPVTLFICYNFEKYYSPLNTFIALRAILNPYDYDKVFQDDQSFSSEEEQSIALETASSETGPLDESSCLLEEHSRIRRRKSTIDEEREEFTNYTYPYLIDPLDGPWVGFNGDSVAMVEYRINGSVLEQGHIINPAIGEFETIVNKKLVVSEWE